MTDSGKDHKWKEKKKSVKGCWRIRYLSDAKVPLHKLFTLQWRVLTITASDQTY